MACALRKNQNFGVFSLPELALDIGWVERSRTQPRLLLGATSSSRLFKGITTDAIDSPGGPLDLNLHHRQGG